MACVGRRGRSTASGSVVVRDWTRGPVVVPLKVRALSHQGHHTIFSLTQRRARSATIVAASRVIVRSGSRLEDLEDRSGRELAVVVPGSDLLEEPVLDEPCDGLVRGLVRDVVALLDVGHRE